MSGCTVLVADDEAEVRRLLRLYLENAGYRVLEAENGAEALSLLESDSVDLCLLDLMMPVMDGYTALRELRKAHNLPVIILSARDADSEKILGLNLGADDYLAKPFNPLEVAARVNACLRRFTRLGSRTAEPANLLRLGELELDRDACILRKNGEEIPLSSVEYRIMVLFMENPGRVFTKQQIYETGWQEDFIVSDNNIMVCISKLRGKLDPDNNRYIRTIRGLGYRMEKQA